ANVNAVNRYGVPPLSLACSNGSGAIAKLLLEGGANANATMKSGETVLMMAARSGNLEAVNALLARGARPDPRERPRQTAPRGAGAGGTRPVRPRTERRWSGHQYTVRFWIDTFFLCRGWGAN